VLELINKLQMRTGRCATRARLAISESISKPQPGENKTREFAIYDMRFSDPLRAQLEREQSPDEVMTRLTHSYRACAAHLFQSIGTALVA
jgi:hypothetical protein